MKKFCSVFLVFIILSLFSGCGAPDKKAQEKETEKLATETEQKTDTAVKSDFPEPRAASAVVINADSGEVLYSLHAKKKLYPSNITNIMTALVALENASLGDVFTVPREAISTAVYDHSDLRLNEGESYTLEQLLYPVLLTSLNDASPYARVVAFAISGSIDGFTQKMNEKAEELGLKNTKFANPTGAFDEEHYTTAADMAKLARYAMQNDAFCEIVKTPVYSMGEKKVYNTNNLVSRYIQAYHFYNKAVGIKAANSEKSGNCLVAAAKTDDLNLISVVMGSHDTSNKDENAYSYVDTVNMCEYVFENFKSVLLIEKGYLLDSAKVSDAKDSARVAFTVEDDVYMTLENTADVEAISKDIEITKEVKAPIHRGDSFGTVTYSYNGKSKTVDVVAANDVKRDNIAHFFGIIFGFIFNPFVLLVIILIAAAWIRMNIMRKRKRTIRRKRLVSQNGGNSGAGSRKTSSRSRSFDRFGGKNNK